MKQQLFYRSPGINENEGSDDEQPVDETSTDASEETNSEDGATDEDATVGEDTGSDEGATDENPTSDEETDSDDSATDENPTSGEETDSGDSATDENLTSGEETDSGEGATDENPTSDEETDSDDSATGENPTSGEETDSGEGATDENPTSGEQTDSGEGTTDENNGSGEETTDENATSEDDTNSDEGAVDENNTEGQEAETEENNTEEGANTEGQEAEHEKNNTEEGNTTEGQQSENEGNNSEEEEHESHEIENETVHNNGQETGTEETNTVSTPPVAVAWPGNLSQLPVTSPGDELATFITAIKANRANVPDHLTDNNKVKNGYMYDPFSGKPQPQPTSIQPNTVDAWIWEELRSEGSYTSINTYDNMVVTWGRGVAGANIAKVLKSVFGAHSDIQTEFNNVGIALNANGILQVVDTAQNCVKEGSFALQTIKADKKLLDFLVDISLNDKYKEVFLDAQWNFVKTFNATLIAHVNASKWSKDAVQLMFHFNWWLPAYGWNGHPQNYKDTGGDVSKIIYIFAGNLKKNSVLVGYLKKFAGNAFSKYVAKPEYQGQPSGEHIVFEDGGKTYYFPKV